MGAATAHLWRERGAQQFLTVGNGLEWSMSAPRAPLAHSPGSGWSGECSCSRLRRRWGGADLPNRRCARAGAASRGASKIRILWVARCKNPREGATYRAAELRLRSEPSGDHRHRECTHDRGHDQPCGHLRGPVQLQPQPRLEGQHEFEQCPHDRAHNRTLPVEERLPGRPPGRTGGAPRGPHGDMGSSRNLSTTRLALPPLTVEHIVALAGIYADPVVARYIGGTRLTPEVIPLQVAAFAEE
jgi:hypothetical protein